MAASADPSTQFILEAQAPFLANLAALWAVDPALAGVIDAIEDDQIYTVEPSRAGPPTVAVNTSDGRRVYLHSRYEPVEEAKKLLEPANVGQKMTFYILGFGLGYHVSLLFEQAGDESIFCIFEPDARMIRTALTHRDFSALIRSDRVTFFTAADKAYLFQKLSPHTALISMGTQETVHAASRQLNEPFYGQIETWLGEFGSFCRTNMNTLVLNSRKTAENIANNIGWYVATPGLARLKDRYRGKPAVIVSAGPSLSKNKHLLKGLEQNAVMIAVQTTLKPLLELGVEPHYVTSLDYHEICSRFFEDLPANLQTELIAEPKATASIFGMMPGPVTVIGCDFAEGLVRELKLDKPALTSGATVAHLAFYLAEYLGCDPIIFVGQDLGFSDGLCYAPGTSYEDVWRPELSRFCTVEMKQWEQIVRDRPILRRIPDQQGRPMYTEERLFAYLHQFERDFGKSKARIIDATEGGALKRGATVMPLAEAIEKYCGHALAANWEARPTPRWDLLPDCIRSIETRGEESRAIEKISRDTLPLLEEIRDHVEDQSRVNRAIARVDELRWNMNQLGRTYAMITQLTQQTELTRFERDRKLAAEKLEGIDRQKRQIIRDIDNVKAVIEAAGEFQKLMTEIAAHLRTQLPRRAKEAA